MAKIKINTFKPKTLQEAVERWIRAEHYFRLSPIGVAYSMVSQDALIEAERDLRELVTGKRQLGEAGQKLGCEVEESPKKKCIKKKLIKKKVTKKKIMNVSTGKLYSEKFIVADELLDNFM